MITLINRFEQNDSELERAAELLKENGFSVETIKFQDGLASVFWSVNDVVIESQTIGKEMSNDEALKLLVDIKEDLVEKMTETGWDIISYEISEYVFNAKKYPNSFDYVIENDTVTKRCNRCNSVVLKEPKNIPPFTSEKGINVENVSIEDRCNTLNLPYQCIFCDVNLFECETHEGLPHTMQELDELCFEVRDVLLLDQ